MNIKQLKKDLENYSKRYSELCQYVLVENFDNTRGYEFLGQIEWLRNEMQQLQRLLIYR